MKFDYLCKINQYAEMRTLLFVLLLIATACLRAGNPVLVEPNVVTPGAARFGLYVDSLKGLKVGLVANHASVIGQTHLVDTLINQEVNIIRIFSPEHGFRGNADAGAIVDSYIDQDTQIPVISLYGKKKKPDLKDLKDIDIVLIDLQDVGVRFYTYISTLTYMMQACAEVGIPVKVLDRPNPNGYYIDGPVLDTNFRSFVGLHPVPVVYGLTIGEYGHMVNGEGWLGNGRKCDYTVVPLEGYSRNMICKLPVKPSPNLKSWKSVYLYPSLCFFEGTVVSVGRGTDHPFEAFGHPDIKTGSYSFTPRSVPGASVHPPFKGQTCYGTNLASFAEANITQHGQLQLDWLIQAYNELSNRHKFFNSYFSTLAGNALLKQQIEQNIPASEIRMSWKPDLENYKQIRRKYLIYDDIGID